MQHDSMLQKYLSGPLAIDARELLLTLGAVVADAEKLAERAPPFQAGEPPGLGLGPEAEDSAALSWFVRSVCWAVRATMSGFTLPQGLLD